jgi:hypothetical protein
MLMQQTQHIQYCPSARHHLTAAPSRPRKLLKVVTKSNAQRHGKYRRGDASDGGVY